MGFIRRSDVMFDRKILVGKVLLRKVLGVLGLVLVFVFIFVGGMGSFRDGFGEDEVDFVLKVNGDMIGREQYEDAVNKFRAQVISDFNGSVVDDDFWEDEVNGVSPKQALEELAVRECVETQVLLGLGREEGLTQVLDYNMLVDEMNRENVRRQEAVSRGEAIYGPITYTKDFYLDYVLSNLRIDLLRIYRDDRLKVSDSELKDYYEVNKQALDFSLNPREVRVKMLSLEVASLDSKTVFEDALNEIALNEIAGAADFDLALGELEKRFDLQVSELSVVENSVVYNRNEEVMKQVLNLEVGHGSEVFQMNDSLVAYFRIPDLHGEQNIAKEQAVKEQLISMCLRDKFDALIDKLVMESDVEVLN